MMKHPGHPPVEFEGSLLDWLGWFVGWVAGFYLDVVLVFSPFLIARLVLGRWPWPLRVED